MQRKQTTSPTFKTFFRWSSLCLVALILVCGSVHAQEGHEASSIVKKYAYFEGSPELLSKESHYDAHGHLVKETIFDEFGEVRSKTLVYDAQGHLDQEHHSRGAMKWSHSFSYEYDAQGRVALRTSSSGAVRKYEYRDGGAYRWEESFSDQVSSEIYEADGSLFQACENKNCHTYMYDSKGNMIEDYASGPYASGSTNYVLDYDDANRLVKRRSRTTTTVYSYYPDGKLKSEVASAEDSKTYIIRYVYDTP